jgi:hypothetical protein
MTKNAIVSQTKGTLKMKNRIWYFIFPAFSKNRIMHFPKHKKAPGKLT